MPLGKSASELSSNHGGPPGSGPKHPQEKLLQAKLLLLLLQPQAKLLQAKLLQRSL